MKVALKKGSNVLAFDWPGDSPPALLEGSQVPALGRQEISRIITRGIRDTAPADLGFRKIAVIIPDNTRLWARGDLFIPVIIRTLSDLGADLDRISIIIALGTHRDIPASGFDALCGKGIPDQVRVLNSGATDESRLVSIGTTAMGTPLQVTREAWEADHIIIFGGVLHHMLAGFGGGRKYILPGIAGADAIRRNHSLAIRADGSPHPMVRQSSLSGNPVHEDMADGAALFLEKKSCCYAAVAANGKGELFWAGAGDLKETFETGCRELDRACAVTIPEKADFCLFSAGGIRTDGQLYQSTKALFNAVNAVREKGTLVFTAACGDGIGNPAFAHALKTYRSTPEHLGRELARNFSMPAYVALRVIDLLTRFRIILVSDLAPDLTRELGFEYMPDPAAFAAGLSGRGYLIPHAENVLPLVKNRTEDWGMSSQA